MRNIYILILIATGLYFILSTLLNSIKTLKTTHKGAFLSQKSPLVSVLIPARNEEKNIARCIESLLHQTYSNYEILVLDDNSTDATYKTLKALKKKNPSKLFIYKGLPLMDGWRGKSYAMKQLTDKARGDIFLFTDADTVHSNRSIELMLLNMKQNDADLVSGYIYQRLNTIGEKLTVPVMYLLTAVIPMFLNSKLKTPAFCVAIGQYIGVRRDSFFGAGGYDAIKGITTEDMYLARRFKECGYKTVFLDFSDAASCRMYNDGLSAIKGIGKNVFDFMWKNNIVMFGIVYAILCFIILPIMNIYTEFFKCLMSGAPSGYLLALIFINMAFFFTWSVIFHSRRLPVYLALFYPCIFLNLLVIVLFSWVKSNSSGYTWKGRTVKQQ